MAGTYTGTNWVTHTKITTDIMKTMDEGIESNKEAVGSANTAADNAQSAADNAQSAADNAQSAADNAQSAADNAQSAADKANAAVESEKGDRESADNDLSDKIQANSDLVSDTFDTSKEYSAGDYCIYDNVLYKFTADKESGDWDSSKVEATTAAEEIKNNAESIQENTDLIDSLASDYIILIDNTSSSTVTISANSSLSVNNYVDAPTAPDGYKGLMSVGAYATGDAAVVSCAPFGSSYVINTSSSSKAVTLHRFRFFIRDI